MKVFWISLILFSLLLGATVFNGYYIRKTVGEMQDLLREAQETERRAESLSSLAEIWEQSSLSIGFTVGARKIEEIESLMTELTWAYHAELEDSFEKNRLLLLSATEELIRYETVSAEAIL